jgi:hypothetical protein
MPTIPPPVRALLAADILAVAAIFFWMLPARTPDRASAPAPARPAPEGVAGDAGIRSAATPAPLPPITVLPIATELSQTLLRRDAPVESLQAVEQLIYLYRQALGENPVGQNEDIVATLLGENPKRAAWLPADSPAIKEGKLVDVWGTPYWFHPVSRDRMEVRSAGPDRELFTGDDLLGN